MRFWLIAPRLRPIRTYSMSIGARARKVWGGNMIAIGCNDL